MSILNVEHLSHGFGDRAIFEDVSFRLLKGEHIGLVGANGAGKTTLLKILAGQIFHSEGEFALFGSHEKKELENQRKRLGALIENPGFYPQMTIVQNMEFYRLQKGVPGKQIVEDTLKTVGLWEVRNKKGKTLSLGMKQRLGLAIALLGEPELLFLDEPANGLDPAGIIEMRNLLKKLNREKNITIVISSHILSELEQLATVYGFLDKGKMLEQISAKALYEKCGDYLEIKVTDAAKYTMLLEKQMQHTSYLVLEDGMVQIFDMKFDRESYSALAGENGIGILAMNMKQNSLEDYYMNLTKGGQLV